VDGVIYSHEDSAHYIELIGFGVDRLDPGADLLRICRIDYKYPITMAHKGQFLGHPRLPGLSRSGYRRKKDRADESGQRKVRFGHSSLLMGKALTIALCDFPNHFPKCVHNQERLRPFVQAGFR
jgi:hypothetical protein